VTTNHPAPLHNDRLHMTFNERLEMYQRHRKALIEELELIFNPDDSGDRSALGRAMCRKMHELCPDKGILLECVAQGVITAAKRIRAQEG